MCDEVYICAKASCFVLLLNLILISHSSWTGEISSWFRKGYSEYRKHASSCLCILLGLASVSTIEQLSVICVGIYGQNGRWSWNQSLLKRDRQYG